jgi:hypothetical protein
MCLFFATTPDTFPIDPIWRARRVRRHRIATNLHRDLRDPHRPQQAAVGTQQPER